MLTDAKLAAQIMQRIEALAQITDVPGTITRLYGGSGMGHANKLVSSWMREAGMTTEQDAIGNLIGRYPASQTPAKSFLIGSHLDTVRDAGRFDGVLGVLVGLACVEKLHSAGQRLPFAVEVLGFADEEGVRFQSAYLGSRVLAGTFDFADLKREDTAGVTLREAILRFVGDPDDVFGARRASQEILGYAEVHIEQGPVLESKNLPVGVVTAISGQTRIETQFVGRAGHAGTTPMADRRDALVAAAHFIVAAERLARSIPGLVVTVGQISIRPGASNVIPGSARLTVDVRHENDVVRERACKLLRELAEHLTFVNEKRSKGLVLHWKTVQSTNAVLCSADLSVLLKKIAARIVPDVIELPSGAGHDAAILAAITPVAMLFVRCKDGISHHPDESATEADVCIALQVMSDFLQELAARHG